jgi:hypothetical protein
MQSAKMNLVSALDQALTLWSRALVKAKVRRRMPMLRPVGHDEAHARAVQRQVRGDESDVDRSPAKQTSVTRDVPGPSAANANVKHEVGSQNAANPTGVPQNTRVRQRCASDPAMEKEANLDTEAREPVRGKRGRSPRQIDDLG